MNASTRVFVLTLFILADRLLAVVSQDPTALCKPLQDVGCDCTVIRTRPSGTTFQYDITCKGKSTFTGPHPDLRHIKGDATISLSIFDRKVEELTSSFFKGTNLTSLRLHNTGLRKIAPYLLKNVYASSVILRLDNNWLTEIPNSSFEGKDVYELDLRYNNFTAIPLMALSNARTVGRLFLDGNRLGSGAANGALANNSFGGLTGLLELSMKSCEFTDIKPGAFRGLFQLLHLYLDYNLFTHIRPWYFNLTRPSGDTTQSLQTLYLNHNRIEHIEPGVFNQSRTLRKLYLDNNMLKEIRAGVFNGRSFDELTLAHNKICCIEKWSFKGVTMRKGTLDLSFNNLTELGESALDGLTLEEDNAPPHGPSIRLDFCNIQSIGTNALKVTNLKDLKMRYNAIKSVTSAMFGDLDQHFMAVELEGNSLESVPAITSPNLRELLLNKNNISYVGKDDLKNLTGLVRLEMKYNERLAGIHRSALKGLIVLNVLKLDYCSLKELPDFADQAELVEISASFNRLKNVSAAVCSQCPKLYALFLGGNRFTSLPNLEGCTDLVYIHLHDNPMGNLPDNAFATNIELRNLVLRNVSLSQLPVDMVKSKKRLAVFDASENQIVDIPLGFFAESFELRDLRLNHNRIRTLGATVLHNVTYLDRLYLSDNDLRAISNDAWHNYTLHFLTLLDLSDNPDLAHLPAPGEGFPHLSRLFLSGCPKLERVPPPQKTPRLVTVEYTYGYHCCLWQQQFPKNWQSSENTEEWFDSIELKNYRNDLVTIPSPSTAPPTPTARTSTPFQLGGIDVENIDDITKHLSTLFPDSIVTFTPGPLPTASVSVGPREWDHPTSSLQDFTCLPRISLFTPCENLMGSWALRVCVWAVVILALFGNAAVLFVLVASRKSMDVPQFLVCNLAFADLCLGVYLAFISVVDLQTQGNDRFYLSAIPWQNGPGCKTAGFFAIFATELSVYCLVLITFERVYTISNVMKQKQISIKVAVLLVLVGWLLSAGLAILPLANIGANDYSAVCVCLPFLFQGAGDKAYLVVIVTCNIVALVLIAAFYFRIYWLTRKTQAANSGPSDRKLIRSILMLTVVDFLCWVPLSVITLAAVGGAPDILNTSAAKWLVVLVFPINACANPFLYAIFTKKFREHIKTLVCCSTKNHFPFRPQQLPVGGGASRDRPRPQYAERRASISIAEFHRRMSSSSVEGLGGQPLPPVRERSNSIQPLLGHFGPGLPLSPCTDQTSIGSGAGGGAGGGAQGRRASLPSPLLATPLQRGSPLSGSREIQYLNALYSKAVPPISLGSGGEECSSPAPALPTAGSPLELQPLAPLLEASHENVCLDPHTLDPHPLDPHTLPDPLSSAELRSFSKVVDCLPLGSTSRDHAPSREGGGAPTLACALSSDCLAQLSSSPRQPGEGGALRRAQSQSSCLASTLPSPRPLSVHPTTVTTVTTFNPVSQEHSGLPSKVGCSPAVPQNGDSPLVESPLVESSSLLPEDTDSGSSSGSHSREYASVSGYHGRSVRIKTNSQSYDKFELETDL